MLGCHEQRDKQACPASPPSCTNLPECGLQSSWWCGCGSRLASTFHRVVNAGVAYKPPGSAGPSGQLAQRGTSW
eukprot:9301213-Lingulodinium_polyedra.AAC.1